MRRKLAGIGLALAFGTLPFTAHAVELTLYHTWSNESEMGALNTIVDAFVAQGKHTVVAASTPHETGGESALVNLFVAGTPPNLFIAADSSFFRDLESKGQAQDVRALFDKIGATAAFPKTVLDAITIDGKVLKIPVAVHIDGMVYYNKKVAEAAGVDPTKWTSLDDMWADQKKVNDAGYTFIAIGGNTFQAGYTFHPLLAAVAGPEIYNRFYAGTPDKTVFDEPALKQAIETLGKIFRQTDEGWVNRAWNDTTNTVVNGTALMQIHGDWMKGVWRTNGKQPGVDFGCMNIPGTKALSVTVDSFGILGGADPATIEAEEEFAAVVVDPKINAEFAYLKGSSPVRIDVPTDKLDECNKVVLDSLAKPDYSVQNPFYIGDLDWINSVWNTMFEYQSNPDMTADQVIEMLKEEYDAVFG
jgi:ABC-type glycerol-3-phosphate transport system substrate-binding protein